MSIISFLIFLILIGLLIFSHELGHYLVAKANNIRVTEFMIGMGPVLLSFTSAGTKYSLRLLPFGGACVMDGMDGVDDSIQIPGMQEKEEDELKIVSPSESVQDGYRSFPEAGIWARLATIFAGPLFNLIFSFLMAVIVVGTSYEDLPIVQNCMPGYPVEQAGIQPGDKIVKIDGENIHLARQINLITTLRNGETLNIEYERDGKRYGCVVTPVYDEEYGKYMLGLNGYAEYVRVKGLDVTRYARYEVELGATTVIKSLKILLSGKGSKDDIAGPVGMAQLVGEVAEESIEYGVLNLVINMVNLAMLLSVNLFVVNLLPLPALDGGRILFLLIELVRGKPVSREKEGFVHLIGFALLFALTIFILFNDISRFFRR